MVKQSPLERRQSSKPWLIGLGVFAATPLTSIIYGWRQRSWFLAILPISAVMVAVYFTPPYEYNKIIRRFHQAGAGLIAYKISTELKKPKNERYQ